MFIIKKGHQPGVYVPLRALFLVIFYFWPHQNRLAESIVMSTHNMGFYEEINKIIPIPTLSCLLVP